jgi:hypothetical protein
LNFESDSEVAFSPQQTAAFSHSATSPRFGFNSLAQFYYLPAALLLELYAKRLALRKI